MADRQYNWTLQGFDDHVGFVHNKMLDQKFVWVLGAGASLSSGLPLGSTLVDQWLEELHRREVYDGDWQEWAKADVGIVGFDFDRRAEFYAEVYQRRFQLHPDEGYAYLENLMANKDPSPGYSILAAVLGSDPPRHNAVVTTNFDNLVADAVSIYTDTFPFVCGHESLTEFVRIAPRRPLICKIHRDLLLGPQNDPRSLKRLHDAWGRALRALFEHYTPIFIGYGGNDDTLMDLLESLTTMDITGRLIWCYHESGEPSERIRSVVASHEGILVPVPDFDALMVLVGEQMNVGLLDGQLEKQARERVTRYRQRVTALGKIEHPTIQEALAETVSRSGGWFGWHGLAKREADLVARARVYEKGLKALPESADLKAKYVICLAEQGDLPAAQTQLEALNYSFESANNTGHLALAEGEHEAAALFFRHAATVAKDSTEKLGLALNELFLADWTGNKEELEVAAAKIEGSGPEACIHSWGFEFLTEKAVAESKFGIGDFMIALAESLTSETSEEEPSIALRKLRGAVWPLSESARRPEAKATPKPKRKASPRTKKS